MAILEEVKELKKELGSLWFWIAILTLLGGVTIIIITVRGPSI